MPEETDPPQSAPPKPLLPATWNVLAPGETFVGGMRGEALFWRTEQQAFEQAQNVAADDASTPAGVKILRAAFRQQLARLDQDRTAKTKELLATYDAILAKNQTLLTQRQRLDDALLLKTKRDEIARAWLGSSPPTTSEPAGHPETPKSGAILLANKDQPFENSLGMKFVPVTISGGPTNGKRVLFSVWDTRVQDYEVFAQETGRDWPKAGFEQGPTHPAVTMNWDDTQAFCAWLTDKERASGRIGARDEYRLPSDHEWSCAVGIGGREKAEANPESKSGKIQVYPWGTQWPPPKGAGNYAGEELRAALAAGKYPYVKGVIAGHRDDFVETSPVGSFAANRFGLFDMGGNVWQWCEDWFDHEQKERVLRGASWVDNTLGSLPSSVRLHHAPDVRHTAYGFRCVLAPASSTP